MPRSAKRPAAASRRRARGSALRSSWVRGMGDPLELVIDSNLDSGSYLSWARAATGVIDQASIGSVVDTGLWCPCDTHAPRNTAGRRGRCAGCPMIGVRMFRTSPVVAADEWHLDLKVEGHVAVLSLNRPDKLNAWS